MEKRNVGVLAHVDTGKTTLTEQMLKLCGAIRQAGSVDAGTAHTDRLEVEKRRGISVKAACVPMIWRDVEISLIDTPGHTDFAAEVERSLWAIDGVVLMLDAVEGVTPQAEHLFRALREMRMPTLLFVNKTDRESADAPRVLREARALLGEQVTDASSAEKLMERVAECDESAMADYLEGHIWRTERITQSAAALTARCEMIPLLSGSALRGEGVDRLLDAMVTLLPPPLSAENAPLCAVVFGVECDRAMGRAALCRVFTGSIRNRQPIGDEKITQIRKLSADGRTRDAGVLLSGEIGVLYGLSGVKAGELLGDESYLPRPIEKGRLCDPLMMAKVMCDPAKKPELRAALDMLAAEDGHFSHEELDGAEHIRVMGLIQLEILQEQLLTRFGLTVQFGEPTVIYRETIAAPAVGFYAYTMPKPCWAVIEFLIEPLPRGRGVEFASVVPVRDVMERYQHQVRQAIPLAVRQGLAGWQVDDVKITMTAGEHHLIHTHPLDFIVCTPIAFMDGLRRGGSVLLEPMMRLSVTAPEGDLGRITSDLIKMDGTIRETDARQGRCRVTARVPLRRCMRYPVQLAAQTRGAGAMTMALDGYREAPPEVVAVCPRKSVNPLDTAKYILAARSALEGAIFDGI